MFWGHPVHILLDGQNSAALDRLMEFAVSIEHYCHQCFHSRTCIFIPGNTGMAVLIPGRPGMMNIMRD